MGNIKFSADMVGIQTLAQQGVAAPTSDSVLAFSGGSFEDMILQMISNNLSIDEVPEEDSENVQQIMDVLNGMMIDNEDENFLTGDALYNLINPDVLAQMMAMYNIQPVDYANAADQPVDMLTVNTVADANILEGVNVAEVINPEVQMAVAESSQQTDTITKVFEDVAFEITETVSSSENTVDVNNVANNTFEKTEDVLNEVKSVLGEAVRKTGDVAENSFTANKRSSEESMSDSTADMNFVSTADMLQLRSGSKIEFAGRESLFKVSELPIDIENDNAAQDLADRILMKFNENEFEVELYPKSLGKISINLVIENGIVNVAMSSTNDKVNEFLASQSANIQSIVEKNTQYQAVVKLDDTQSQYQQRDNTQQSADESQRERQQEHLQRMYQQNGVQHTEDFLSMLRLV